MSETKPTSTEIPPDPIYSKSLSVPIFLARAAQESLDELREGFDKLEE